MTKKVRYVLDKPKEFFVHSGTGEFVKVKGKPVKIKALPGEDIFIHPSLSGDGVRLSEGITGMSFGGTFDSKQAAVADAYRKLRKSKKSFPDMIKVAVRRNGYSPRYRKEGGKK